MKASDVLHYYLGQQVFHNEQCCRLESVGTVRATIVYPSGAISLVEKEECKLILKDIEKMPEDERRGYGQFRVDNLALFAQQNLNMYLHVSDAAATNYLIKQGYDVFGLIRAGLAHDEKLLCDAIQEKNSRLQEGQ